MYKLFKINHSQSNGSKKNTFLVTGLLCACILSMSQESVAQGVEAGTSIINIATVSYSIDSNPQASIDSSPTGNTVSGPGNGQPTQFIVDRKIDLLVTGNTNANVNPGDTQAEVTFTLQNEGNAIQEFALQIDNLVSLDNFDPNSCNYEVTGVTGTPVSGVVLPTNGNIKLSPDQQASVSIKCDIPLDNAGNPILTGHTAQVGLIATAEKNANGTDAVETSTIDNANSIETVFADGEGTNDLNNDAMHSDRRTYIASTGTLPPVLTMDKSIVSVVDPNGGNTAITGSEVTYKIQVNTSGTGSIDNVVITDPTPADMTYKTNSITLNNSNQSDASDANDNTDFGISNVDTATINLGNFAAGSQYEIQLTYIIN